MNYIKAKFNDLEKHLMLSGDVDNNFITISLDKVKRLLGRPKIDCYGINNLIEINDGSSLQGFRVLINGDNNNVIIGTGVRLKNTIVRVNGDGCKVFIGSKTTIEGAKLICQEDGTSINIGEDCMLSEEIIIRTSDSHSILDLETSKRINYPGDVALENHVWIGREVHINKNVIIGSGSVVASRAVVSKNVNENTLVGGLPAKKIKENITWTRDLK